MSIPSRRPALAALCAAVLSLSLAACSSSSGAATPELDANANVAFNSCSEVACDGTIDGAAYTIKMPEKWNGTLLLWSHGYRYPEPAPPTFEPVNTAAEAVPGGADDGAPLADELLKRGYALAGSAYASNGWAVADGVKAGEALHQFFVDKVGQPNRTYVWGASLGGLITQVLAESNPDWVSAAMPLCGAVAGPVLNFDLALDLSYAVQQLFDPGLKITGYASWDEAVAEWQEAVAAITAQASDLTNGVPKILLIAGLVDAPSQTASQDGSTTESTIRGYAEAVATALGFSTFVRYEMEQRAGGNPSDNTQAQYPPRISESERALIEAVSPGATDRLLAQLDAGQRVKADSAARAKIADLGETTGAIKDPTLTLHTKADPLVISQNETVLAQRAAANPDRTDDLVQLYTVAPASYGGGQAPYGAGHCNFTGESYLAMVDLANDWVTQGVYPQQANASEAFGPDSGYAPTFVPGDWPAPESDALD